MGSIEDLVSPLSFPMIDVEEACALVRRHVTPLKPVVHSFRDALGHILAEDIIAPDHLPPFPASVVDGYAMRVADGHMPRILVGEQTAGQQLNLTLGPGKAIWVTTGAPIPDGADTVVKLEDTEKSNNHVVPKISPRTGSNIRPVGYDIHKGERVLERGIRLGPAEVGVLATVNALNVRVYPRPRVAIFSTGDELIEPGTPLTPGKIRDSNRHTLIAAVRAFGGIPIDLGQVHDEIDKLSVTLKQGLAQADMIISSGGVSMGSKDLLKTLLSRHGTIYFGRVRVKPGKPVTFALVDETPVFALPGNPVSALVAFYLYVVPALRMRGGDVYWQRAWVRVRLGQDIHHTPGRVEFQRARVRTEEGVLWAYTTGVQASSRLLSMVHADVLLRLEADWEDVPKGTELRAMVLAPTPTWLGEEGGDCV